MSTKSILAMLAAGALLIPAGGYGAGDDEEVTFHSDVSLVRVDVQVLESGGRAVTGLTADDFQLRDNGKIVPIRNFAREEMPIDVLFLLDVSGSMQPHIRSVAQASRTALNVLGKDDRVAVMVFDRSTRVRSPFKSAQSAYTELEHVIDRESFNGGTDITGALKDSINYVARTGRKEGRKAIIIVTDDMTEFQTDIPGIERMLTKNDIVLSALIAPDAMGNGYPGGGGYPNGGGYPRRRGGIGIGLPGIGIPGTGGGYPGGGYPTGGGQRIPGGGRGGNGQTPAGSAEIARASGGDSFSVYDAGALEDTLQRLRQRYALFFHSPAGSREGQERTIEVALVGRGARAHSSADLKYRDSYIATAVADDGADTDNSSVSSNSSDRSSSDRGSSDKSSSDGAPSLRRSSRSADAADSRSNDSGDSDTPRIRRRPAVSEPSATGPTVWRKADPSDNSNTSTTSSANANNSQSSAPAPVADSPAPQPQAPTQTRGWRKATPEDTH